MGRHVALTAPRKDGSRLIDHLEATGGDWQEAFPPPDPPAAASDIWDWYWELRAAAPSGMNGPNPVSWTELEAWSRLTARPLSRRQLHLLRLLDVAFLNSHAEQANKAR